MPKKIVLLAMLLQAPLYSAPVLAAPLSAAATDAAAHALAAYPQQMTASLAAMVSYNTVADPAVPFDKNPQHLGFKQFLKEEAARLGFDFRDDGYVVVIGLGQGTERVGIVTHGDVQPVNPAKWARSPFELDAASEPGRLIARGAEDDKGPVATALYAMRAIKDQNIALSKRLELYVYMAEESDWAPLEAFLRQHTPPQMNITLDAEYPVVTAEKGYGSVKVTMPAVPAAEAKQGKEPLLREFGGGFFGSQIPEDASAVIANATPALEAQIRRRAGAQKGMRYQYSWQGRELKINALGVSAHSSKPEDGVNAISMLADALKVRPWRATAAAGMVTFLNDLVGTGIYGERFGKVAYRDSFMGPMTVAPTVLKQQDGAIELNINVRRPRGKTSAQVQAEFQQAFDEWQRTHVKEARIALQISEPWVQDDAPQVPVLLDVFSHYTGTQNAQPRSIGGGTNSRLFPKAVAFGPAMPGSVYTGHSEHEFITTKQLLLNLQMYTAVLVELAR
jgi:dipeptidase D